MDSFWSIIEKGRVTFQDIPPERWRHDVFYSANQRDIDKSWTAKGSFIEEFQEFAALHYGIAPRRLEVMDPQQRLLIEATRWAIQDAGYERKGFDRRRTGVFFGVSVSEFKNIAQSRIHAMRLAGGDFGYPVGEQALWDALMKMSSRVTPMRAFTLSGSLMALAAAAVAQTFDLGGPAYIIDSACASASVAVNDAILHLRAGALDFAVAGGVYINLAPDNLVAFTKIGAISPSGVCRPFDHRSDGFVQSDGVGVVMLRRLDDAIRDGDRIHAVIIGSACNNDGRGEGPMTPRFEGQLEVLRAAYQDAGVSPNTVDYFEAHGTATSIGDPVEVQALGRLLLEHGAESDNPAKLGSIKGNIGHAMSAAGIAALIKAIKMLEHGIAPPHPGYEKPNPRLGIEDLPLKVSNQTLPLSSRDSESLRVGVSSFGFGGTNSHIILEKWFSARRDLKVSEPIEISITGAQSEALPEAILLSAPNWKLLKDYIIKIEEFLTTGNGVNFSLADIAYTLNARRNQERFRAVIGARTAQELVQNLRLAYEALVEEVRWPLQVNAHISIFDAQEPTERVLPKLAFLFPGQGAQKVGILSGLRRRFATFAQAIERYETALDDLFDRPLTSYLYPDISEAQGEEALNRAETDLAATQICQPAMAALGLSLSELFASFNVQADVSLGHSLGEFAALANGSILDSVDAVRLVAQRGAAMQALNLEDPGAMAAVMSDAKSVRDIIRSIDGVVVANVNNPKQVVISGLTASVDLATDRLVAEGHDVRKLNVSHAFHSPLLEPVQPAIEKLVETTTIQDAKHVVASCIASTAYSADQEATRAVMNAHATAPVEFSRGLEQAHGAGATVYLQVGAGSSLVAFARSTLGRDIQTLTSASVADDGGYELLRSLVTLAAIGFDVDFEKVYLGEGRRVVSLPETPLQRDNYWVVRPNSQALPELSFGLSDSSTEQQGERVVLPKSNLADVAGSQEASSLPIPKGDIEVAKNTELPAAGVGGKNGVVKESNSSLLSLFQKQADILKAHAEIIAAQNRLLLQGDSSSLADYSVTNVPEVASQLLEVSPPVAQSVAAPVRAQPSQTTAKVVTKPKPKAALSNKPSPQVSSAPKPVAKVSSDEVRQKVIEVISKISAFPADSLRFEQRLVDELGFDSLMVADLGGALEAKFPSAGGLPQSLFSLETTVGDIASHFVATIGQGAGGVFGELENASVEAIEPEIEDFDDDALPHVRRFRVVPHISERASDSTHTM